MSACLICEDTSATVDGYDDQTVQCHRCGRYRITGTATRAIPAAADFKDIKPYLMAATRQASERGETLLLTDVNWRGHAEAHAHTSVSGKLSKLLEELRKRSAYVCEPVQFRHDQDYPLADAVSPAECSYLLEYLKEEDRIRLAGKDPEEWRLTVKGWRLLEPIASGVPGLCFVAMSFATELTDGYENGIKPAIESECGMKAIRVDREHFGEKICDRMVADIRRAQFVVADVTKQSPGVYFEAGFALALGRDVIWTCREDDFENVHFDTRQYPHIKWKAPEDLRRGLADSIRARIPGAKLD